ncbi:MAG: hypothetical protein IT340_02310 [Chloroflexi bacterium]|nr:hypothetical protein [Chloroflexota bacterium]
MDTTPPTTLQPRVLLVANRDVRERMLLPADSERLQRFADFDWLECGVSFDRTTWTTVSEDAAASVLVAARAGDCDGLIVCHGSPRIDGRILDAAPRLRLIGELEGDRVAHSHGRRCRHYALQSAPC